MRLTNYLTLLVSNQQNWGIGSQMAKGLKPKLVTIGALGVTPTPL